MIRLDITAEDAAMSITECIVFLLPELRKYNVKKMLKSGELRLNGSVVKKDYDVAAGDVIEIYAPIEFERGAALDICYEDKNFLILNKQPGTMVKAERNMHAPDLLTLVTRYMVDKGEYSESAGYVPFPCYPLDMYTGGLVIFAKNGDMFEILREAINQRRVKRVFKAIVKGCPPDGAGQFRHFYKSNGGRRFNSFSNNSKNAAPVFTKYRVTHTNGRFSIIDIEPVTQLPNQERSHLCAAGYPILGDPVYGDRRLNKRLGILHQALWGSVIEFTTGVNNMLEYINGKQVYTDNIVFPLLDL